MVGRDYNIMAEQCSPCSSMERGSREVYDIRTEATAIYIVASRSSEKCNYCQSLWIKASPNVNVRGNGMPLCPRTLSSQEGKAICTDHEHKSLRVIKRFSSFASNELNLEGILTLIPWTHSRAFVCSCGLCNLECLEPLGCLTVARLQGQACGQDGSL